LPWAARAASFFAAGNFLIFISSRSAFPFDIGLLFINNFTGNLARVYLEALPSLCGISRFLILFVVPVYNVLSLHRKMYTIQNLFTGVSFGFIILF
jgi:hypothetical protein